MRGRLILTCALLTTCSGCTNGDVERLGRIWHRVGDRLNSLTSGVRARMSRSWTALREQSNAPAVLRERVACRLRLDKSLAASAIEVEVSGTTVTLRGSVPESAARKRAVELAESTVGVETVDDQMEPKE